MLNNNNSFNYVNKIDFLISKIKYKPDARGVTDLMRDLQKSIPVSYYPYQQSGSLKIKADPVEEEVHKKLSDILEEYATKLQRDSLKIKADPDSIFISKLNDRIKQAREFSSEIYDIQDMCDRGIEFGSQRDHILTLATKIEKQCNESESKSVCFF